MSITNRFVALIFALVLLLATAVGVLLGVSAIGDLLNDQIGTLKGIGQGIAGLVLALLAGGLGIATARRALKPRAPGAAA
jgi:hypothetical protein